MRARLFYFLIYSLPVACLFSCYSLKAPNFKRIDNVRVSKLGLKESTLILDLHYFNPNKSRLKLKEASGDAWLDGTFLGHFSMDTLIHIPANDSFHLPVKLKVDMGRVFKNPLAVLLSNEAVIKVKGKAKIGKSIVYIRYPITYEGKHNLAELLK